MSDIIQILSEEADHVTTRNASKEQPQAKGKKAAQTPESQPDEALAATNTLEGNNTRRCKGKCHHCGKEGHWACKCCTKKREEAAAAAVAAAANPGTTVKPKNRPIGSANAAFADDSDSDGFWIAKEGAAHVHPDCTEPDPLMGKSESDNEDEEAFHTETWAMEDDDTLDWAGFDDQPAKEGKGWEVEEEARAAVAPLEEKSTPRTKSQPIHRNAPHTLKTRQTLVPREAPDEKVAHLQIISPRGELVIDRTGQTLLERVRAMGHAIWLPKPPPRAATSGLTIPMVPYQIPARTKSRDSAPTLTCEPTQPLSRLSRTRKRH